MPTKIEWTDESWNPVTGCTKISPGCAHCYAERFAERFRGVVAADGKPHPFKSGFDPQVRPERLAQPNRWRSPRMVFVNSMSDLFGEFVPDEYIGRVFEVMRELSLDLKPNWQSDWHAVQHGDWVSKLEPLVVFLRSQLPKE